MIRVQRRDRTAAKRISVVLCGLVLATPSCAEPNPPAPSPGWAQATTPAQRAAAQGVDPRDQYALLDDIETAKGNALRADPTALARVRAAWIDRRLRWHVRVQPRLCGAVGDCVVLPFDHAARAEPINQGWLPRLRLDAQARQDLRHRCLPFARCVVQLEGTLAQFELSSDLPTSLTLSEIEVRSVRNATTGESWTISKRRARLTERIATARRRAEG